MVVSDERDLVLAAADPGAPEHELDRRPRGLYLLGAAGFALAGAAIVYLALAPLGSLDAVVKVPIVLVGLALAYRAVHLAGAAFFGRDFDTGLWLCVSWMVALILAAIFADLLPLAEHADPVATLDEPGNAHPDLFSSHPLGTNNFALDILARCIYGARVSLATSFAAVAVSLAVGGVVGLVAGYRRGSLDAVIGVFTDAMLAFPALVLLVALAAVFGPPATVPEAIVKTGAALAIVSIPTMARLSRANTMVFAQREFVLASRSLGARDRRIVLRELLPNVAAPMLSYGFIVIAVLIVAEGSLAFLGLGLQPPEPTWGNMIAEAGFDTLRNHPHIPLAPGAFMFLTVLSLNRIGERLRNVEAADVAKV